MLLLSRKEKENLVIKLATEGKTTRDIAKEVHISLKDIGKIIRKVTGDEESVEREKEKDQKQLKSPSIYAQAFQMFKDRKSLADVAIELDIKTDVVLDFHRDYLILVGMHGLVYIYQDLRDDFPLFFHLYRRIKKEGLNRENITDLLENQQRLVDLEHRVKLYNEFLRGPQSEKQQLEGEIYALRKKRDNYDGISPI